MQHLNRQVLRKMVIAMHRVFGYIWDHYGRRDDIYEQ
jgi:hypothetical protein